MEEVSYTQSIITLGGKNLTEVISNKTNHLLFQTKCFFEKKKTRIVRSLDNALIKYDAWFLVLLAVIMVLALVIATGLAIWCTVYQGKKFSGSWKSAKSGVSVSTEVK